ncbi:hypothetical protein AB0368_06960 [Actinoplanes sp. NPDC051475]|uniref:hypothetical protein n=1 Tax=Actinoplanes sp. NPDC051475 TaxID=3157225 RepID=UPI00344B1608
MLTAVSPPFSAVARAAGSRMTPWRVVQGTYRRFGAGLPYLPDPMDPPLEEHQKDLGALYGLEFRSDFDFGSARRNTLCEMAEAMLPDLGHDVDEVDLVVLARQTPDADFRRSVACWLNWRLPLAPTPVAVSDQGSAAGFTALRMAHAYVTSAGLRRALVVLADQTSFAFDAPSEQVPATDAMAAFVVEPVDPDDRALPACVLPVVPDHVASAASQLWQRVPTPLSETLVVVGPGIDPALFTGAAQVVTAEPGMPSTGVWGQLAERRFGLPYAALIDFAPGPSLLSIALLDVTDLRRGDS